MKNKIYREVNFKYSQPSYYSFVIAFCYPSGGPVVVKGPENKVNKYINNSMEICHFNSTFWTGGRSVYNKWNVNRPELDINVDAHRTDRYNICYNGTPIIRFKRIPRKFITELSKFDDSCMIVKLLDNDVLF